MTHKDTYYFKKAKEISKISNFNKIHIGCIVVYKNKIISRGYNSYRTHPIQKQYDIYRSLSNIKGVEPKHFMHAEINALNQIKKINIKWNKVKIYIYREGLDGKLLNCRPCPSCINFIKNLKICDIYYTTNDGFCYEKIKY